MNDILCAFNTFIDCDVLSIKKTKGSQNNVYLINTKNKKYIIKQFIDNDENIIKERREQLRISRIWNDNGIKCVQPLSDIFKYKDYYYIVYPFINGLNIDEGELSLSQIKKLAKIQAKIHLLNIESSLPCHIRKINYKNPKIQRIIDLCNKYVDVDESKLCICNNDFKPLNIIWNNDNPIIIDFDAVYKNYPSFSLLESAYTFSHVGSKLNLTYYMEYINAYKSVYNKELDNIDDAINGFWNGKLQWLEYLSKNRENDVGIKDLTDQIIYYQDYVDDIKHFLNNKKDD